MGLHRGDELACCEPVGFARPTYGPDTFYQPILTYYPDRLNRPRKPDEQR